MIEPSGKGSLPSWKAWYATSLPKTAPMLCRLPSAWATETNFQSRYPGGILIPKIGTASPLPCPDAGVIETRRPTAVAAVRNKRMSPFMRSPFECVDPIRLAGPVPARHAAGGEPESDGSRNNQAFDAYIE